MYKHFLCVFAVFILMSCSSVSVTNRNDKSLKFSGISSDFVVEDQNNYGCEKISEAVLNHIFETGVKVNQSEINDNYSTTGCSIKGVVFIDGIKKKFTYEYGGLVYFNDGPILGCGEGCCSENYPHCSYDNAGDGF